MSDEQLVSSQDTLEAPGGEKRVRQLTEKGAEWQLQIFRGKFRNLISQWKRLATECSVLLSDCEDSTTIRDQRSKLEVSFNAISELTGEFTQFEESDITVMVSKFEEIESDHVRLMTQISETLRSLQSDKGSRSSKQTRSSHQLSHMTKMQYLAESAQLRAKLKFHNAESQMKADLEKLQTLKELEIVNAKAAAFDDLDDQLSKLTQSEVNRLPSSDKNTDIRNYIASQTCNGEMSDVNAQVVSTVPGLNHQSTSDHIKTEPTSTAQIGNITLPQPLSVTSNTFITDLNPTVPPFIPPVSAVNISTNQIAHRTDSAVVAQENSVNQGLIELAKSLADQVSLNRLPSPEPNVFYGDPIQYPSWKLSFKTLIDSRKIPPCERIHYLKRYVGGSVKQVIEHYFLFSTDTAYEEAKKLLDERYGDPFVVASAFRDRIDTWPKIQAKDSASLVKFGDFLRQCLSAIPDIPDLRILNDSRENRKMLTKLPEWLVLRWNRLVVSHKESTKEFPSFQKFVDFVTKEAKIASDPVTSMQSLRIIQDTDKRSSGKVIGLSKGPLHTGNSVGTRSFMSNSRDSYSSSPSQNTSYKGTSNRNTVNKKPCSFCKSNHDLDHCKSFQDKTLTERKSFVRENNLCFSCLRPGHVSRVCLYRKTCRVCSKLHPTPLHGDLGRPPVAAETESKANNNRGATISSTATNSEKPSTNVKSGMAFLNSCGVESKCSAIVPVYISHSGDPCKERLIYALLDTQSDTTFILRDTCAALGLSGTPVNLTISTMYAENKVVDSEKVNGLMVRGFDSCQRIFLPSVYTRDIMPANRSHIPTPDVASSWPHLNNIATKLMPLDSCEIGLLIGYNCPQALMPREIIPPKGQGPFGQRTDLGWSIVGIVSQGHVEGDAVGLSHRVIACEVPSVRPLNENISVESVLFSVRTSVKEVIGSDVLSLLERDFGDAVGNSSPFSQEDLQFLSILENNITFNSRAGCYEMPLPFKTPNPILPNNRVFAVSRIKGLQRRLQTDDRFRLHYSNFMQDLLSKGHAERVPSPNPSDGTTWYIPHHGVYHPLKPDKIRVVFDCSSVFQGHSLNQYLLQGPDLTNKLVGVICRFRRELVAVMCDIEQMFYQFKVPTEYRDYLRFLWWDSNDFSKVPVDYRMTVHLFGASSSPGCCNFGLKRVADDNEGEFGSAAANFIRNEFYVDDGVTSLATVSEAIDLIKSTKSMCKKGGLKLHKFVSNKKEVLQCLDPEDRAKNLASIDLVRDKLPVERTLGVLWCIESDTFQFRIVLKDRPLTRRGILSSVSCLYDPLGLIAPVVLLGKQILQQMCADKAEWDDPLPEHLREKWLRWRESLDNLSLLTINRCVKPESFGSLSRVELHHFSDASSIGYGQCSYVRLINSENKVHCALLMGKSRVVPLKPTTIPRLELVAATLSVKIGNLLQQEMQYENVKHIYWTDSKVVIGYICNTARRFHVFVANRVQRIRDHTEPSQWQYICTEQNPADIASRGVYANELVGNKLWFDGPAFLWESSLHLTECENVNVDDNDPEVKKTQSFLVNDTKASQQFPSVLERLEYFSDWQRAKRAAALCLRFKAKLRQRVCNNTTMSVSSLQPISVQELRNSELVICKNIQAASFKGEIEQLRLHSVVDVPSSNHEASLRRRFLKSKSSLSRLDPFLDSDGVLRVGGRIQNAKESSSFRHPILLPKKGHLTELIVRYFHKRCLHQGRGLTTNEIRQSGYWIIGCSSVVSSVISACRMCRRLRAVTLDQKMANLPDDRLEPAPPFSYCAVDLFGPFIIKEGRKELKRYGVLFTCLGCRAIHVETANSLGTDSFISCLRRFISLRGPLRQLRSDRGTNFVGTNNELNQAVSTLDNAKIQEFLLSQNCDYFSFKMNVPAASHMGGVWERQIRSVRSVLAYLLHSHGSQLDDESLRTFLHEAAAIVNCRPLSVENIHDPLSTTPLTPNHLLTLKSKVILAPPGNFQREDLYCHKRWRRTQYLVDQFWSRWKLEFLQNLQVRNKWMIPKRNMCVGDIVILKDDNKPRNQWRLARVAETTMDDDGLVRKVRIALSDQSLDSQGKRKDSVMYLDRPIHKLILLQETEEIPSQGAN